jgi:hypothetical protein
MADDRVVQPFCDRPGGLIVVDVGVITLEFGHSGFSFRLSRDVIFKPRRPRCIKSIDLRGVPIRFMDIREVDMITFRTHSTGRVEIKQRPAA